MNERKIKALNMVLFQLTTLIIHDGYYWRIFFSVVWLSYDWISLRVWQIKRKNNCWSSFIMAEKNDNWQCKKVTTFSVFLLQNI